jgi:hypothetical protein
MFALGLLIAICAFAFTLNAVSKLFPHPKQRTTFFLFALGGLAASPFIYLISPSYGRFIELCKESDRYKVIQTKEVDFLYLDWGSPSDCRTGPQLIAQHAYLGFDCVQWVNKNKELFRYTKKAANQHKGCGLECFYVAPQVNAEAEYRSGYRSGFVDGDNILLTYADGDVQNRDLIPTDLQFSDRLLLDDAGNTMATARTYTYYPYGNGWAKILGLASGSAPTKSCKVPTEQIDPRDVYPSKSNKTLELNRAPSTK